MGNCLRDLIEKRTEFTANWESHVETSFRYVQTCFTTAKTF